MHSYYHRELRKFHSVGRGSLSLSLSLSLLLPGSVSRLGCISSIFLPSRPFRLLSVSACFLPLPRSLPLFFIPCPFPIFPSTRYLFISLSRSLSFPFPYPHPLSMFSWLCRPPFDPFLPYFVHCPVSLFVSLLFSCFFMAQSVFSYH